MKIIDIKWWFGFTGLTIFPFILRIGKGLDIEHEKIHLEQQRKWFLMLWYFGVIAWLFCYLLILPVGWNPFRWKWEYRAYTEGSLCSTKSTKEILRKRYLLWFM